MKIKKTFILLMTAAFTILALSGCVGIVRGSGDVVTETRNVSGFDRVEVNGGGDLYLVQGETESLEIEAEDNIMPYLRSDVVRGTLILEFDDTVRKGYITTRPVKYYLTVDDIHGLNISGGGDVFAEEIITSDLDAEFSGGSDLRIESLEADEVSMNNSGGGKMVFTLLKADSMQFEISGGGSLTVDLMNGDTLDVQASGGSDVRIYDGIVREQRIDMSGGGKYDAPNLQSETVIAELTGGSDMSVWVKRSLDLDASGGGSIYYYGDPSVTSSLSGGSKVQQREK